jgi:hypothetical protein
VAVFDVLNAIKIPFGEPLNLLFERTGSVYFKIDKASIGELINLHFRNHATNLEGIFWVDECLSLMDRYKVSSKGKKWSRGDLYDV